jgi:hypothetical protein
MDAAEAVNEYCRTAMETFLRKYVD